MMDKALEWMKRHAKEHSMTELVRRAAWRFHVDEADLLEEVKRQRDVHLDAKSKRGLT